MGRFNAPAQVLDSFVLCCLIVISRADVSFLLPERGSRLPAHAGLVSARSWDLPQRPPVAELGTVSRAFAPGPQP